MKKLIALLTVLCMLLAVTGCMGGNPMSKYEAALDNTLNLQQIDMDLKIELSQERDKSDASSEDVYIPIDVNIKAIFDEDNKIHRMDLYAINTQSENNYVNFIYANGSLYYLKGSDSSEEEEIYKSSLEIAQGAFFIPIDNTILSAFLMERFVTEDGIESSKKGGNTIIDVELSKEENFKFLSDLINAVGFVDNIDDVDSCELITGGPFYVDSCDASLTIDSKGFISKSNISITTKVAISSSSYRSCNISVEYMLNNPGEDVIIKTPSKDK